MEINLYMNQKIFFFILFHTFFILFSYYFKIYLRYFKIVSIKTDIITVFDFYNLIINVINTITIY